MRTLCLVVAAAIGTLPAVTDVAVAHARSACDDLGGNVQSGNVCHAQVITDSYTIDLRFGTDYPDDEAVSSFLTQQRDHVIGMAQAPGAQIPYNFYVISRSFSSGQPQRTTLGYWNNAVPSTPPHGTQTMMLTLINDWQTENFQNYKSFTWDYDQNRPVTFDNLFAPGVDPMDAVYPLVSADFDRQYAIRGLKLPSAAHDPSHYQNFTITDDAVTFYFRPRCDDTYAVWAGHNGSSAREASAAESLATGSTARRQTGRLWTPTAGTGVGQ